MTSARPLAGRVALVTGASRGIGAAVARRLASSGARVALLARSGDALATLAEEIGGGAVALVCDVRDTGALGRVLDSLSDQLGGAPDIVVNNAGAFFIAPARDTSVDAFAATLAVNLTAPFAVVRALLPAMSASHAGHVVTIGSIADRATFPGNAAYAASKYGLRALHEVLRAELKASGVRVSLVSPGPVDTELWSAIETEGGSGLTPRSEMLSPESVAEAVHWIVTSPADVNVDELRLSHS